MKGRFCQGTWDQKTPAAARQGKRTNEVLAFDRVEPTNQPFHFCSSRCHDLPSGNNIDWRLHSAAGGLVRRKGVFLLRRRQRSTGQGSSCHRPEAHRSLRHRHLEMGPLAASRRDTPTFAISGSNASSSSWPRMAGIRSSRPKRPASRTFAGRRSNLPAIR